MERMSSAELQKMRDLQAKYKRAKREEAEFFKNADDHKGELLKRWEVDGRLHEAAQQYGISDDELFRWITDPEQIEAYMLHHSAVAEG